MKSTPFHQQLLVITSSDHNLITINSISPTTKTRLGNGEWSLPLRLNRKMLSFNISEDVAVNAQRRVEQHLGPIGNRVHKAGSQTRPAGPDRTICSAGTVKPISLVNTCSVLWLINRFCYSIAVIIVSALSGQPGRQPSTRTDLRRRVFP